MKYYQSLNKAIEIVSYTIDFENEDYISPIISEVYSGNLDIIFEEEKGEVEYVAYFDGKNISKKEEGKITILEDNIEKIYFYSIDKEKFLDFYNLLVSNLDAITFADFNTLISEKYIESDFGKLYQIYSINNVEFYDKNTDLYYYVSFTSLDDLKYKINNIELLEEDKFKLDNIKYLVIPSILFLDILNFLVVDYFSYLEGKYSELNDLYSSGSISIINEPPFELYDDIGLRVEKNLSKIWFLEKPKEFLQLSYYFPKIIFENHLDRISMLEENALFIDYIDSESISASYLKGNKISSEDVDKNIISKIDEFLSQEPKELIKKIEFSAGNYNFYSIPNSYYCFNTEIFIENPLEIQIQIPEYLILKLE